MAGENIFIMKRFFVLWCLVLSTSLLYADSLRGLKELINKYKDKPGASYHITDVTSLYNDGNYIYFTKDGNVVTLDLSSISHIKIAEIKYEFANDDFIAHCILDLSYCSSLTKIQFKKDFNEWWSNDTEFGEHYSNRFFKKDNEEFGLLKINDDGLNTYIGFSLEPENIYVGFMKYTDEQLERSCKIEYFMQY